MKKLKMSIITEFLIIFYVVMTFKYCPILNKWLHSNLDIGYIETQLYGNLGDIMTFTIFLVIFIIVVIIPLIKTINYTEE